jgi:hypothetical protein
MWEKIEIAVIIMGCLNKTRILLSSGMNLVGRQKIEAFQFCVGRQKNCAGANPMIAIYKARAVKIYNSTSRLVRFDKRIFFLSV